MRSTYKLFKHFHNQKIWKQITLSTLSIMILVLLASGSCIYFRESSYLIKRSNDKAYDILKLLSASTLEGIISEDIPLLETTIFGITSVSEEIFSIKITNESGVTLTKLSKENTPSNAENLIVFSKKIDYLNENFGEIEITLDLSGQKQTINNYIAKTVFYLSLILIISSAFTAFFINSLIVSPLKTIHKQFEKLLKNKDEEITSINSSPEFSGLSLALHELKNLLINKEIKKEELEKKVEQRTAELRYQATHDILTGFYNRFEFEKRLGETISTIKSDDIEYGIFYMDLDQFKVVNDTCGHLAGDELLRQLGKLLMKIVQPKDTLARIGGDEFALMSPMCTKNQAKSLAQTILDNIRGFRFHWEGRTFSIGISIGITHLEANSQNLNDALSCADIACYTAKNLGRDRFHFYQTDDTESRRHHSEMNSISQIRKAIDLGNMSLHQQKIQPLNNEVNSNFHYEVLLRIQNSDGDILPPAVFLPAAERYQMAHLLDKWVIDSLLRFLSTYKIHLKNLELCSINLSGQTLSNQEYLNEIRENLLNSNIPLKKICFEITETAAITNFNAVIEFITHLKTYGCRFALDDFGTGMSSFSYLKQLPVDFLKIDGCFIRDIVDDPVAFSMIRSINDIAHTMKMKTIAEYVENDAIHQALIKVGVDYVQGYNIAPPKPLEAKI